MFTKHAYVTVRNLLCATTITWAVCAGNGLAKDVTVAIHVSSQGLDLSQPAAVREYYSRIKNAAHVACTRANRAGLTPVDDPRKCAEQSLANTIRAAAVPALTQLYLESHTLREAAAMGLYRPVSVAGRSQTSDAGHISTP